MGPGPLGAPGPRCSLRVVHVTTYCQASYLLSGKLPTVRQATYCQASYLQSGKLPTVRHAPNRSIDMHPKGIDMHPKGIDMHPTVSIDFAPNNRILS